MNEKIPLKRFATAVADKSKIDVAEAEAFIKSLFKLVADELRTGQPVHVGGLGEFRLSNNPDDPVIFIPEVAWADAVNAPFAMFESVELADNITEQELADAAEEITTIELEEPEPEPKATQPELNAESTPTIEPEPIREEEPIDEVAPIAEEITVVDETPKQQIPTAPEPQKTAYRWPEEEEESESPYDDETTSVEEVETAASTKGSFSRGFIVGLIVGLAIGALALCAYVLYYVNTPAGELPLTTELEATEVLPAN